MDSQKKHWRHVMHHCFKKHSSAKDTADGNCTVCGSGASSLRTVRNWSKKFRAGNIGLKDEESSGRPITTNTDLVKNMLAENPRYTVSEIVDATNFPTSSSSQSKKGEPMTCRFPSLSSVELSHSSFKVCFVGDKASSKMFFSAGQYGQPEEALAPCYASFL
uniref:HTH_48 domain-containing protein n=1 Tax=Glossina austeni TaxID=7395 RepID=A0A1A9VL41_GLOAU